MALQTSEVQPGNEEAENGAKETNSSELSTLEPMVSINQGLKRKYEFSGDDCKLAAKARALMASGPKKNALCLINELYRGVDFKIVNQEGPVNAPIFTARVEINGITFEGKGRNKKAAKHCAAEEALRSLVQFKNPSSEVPSLCQPTDLMDFTNDVLYKDINNFGISKATGSKITIPNGSSVKNGIVIQKPKLVNLKESSVEKNPVMLLNELHPCAKYEIVSDNGEQSSKFTMAVTVNNLRFEGKGSSKKLSKSAAARMALLALHNILLPAAPMPDARKLSFCNFGDEDGFPQVFADYISKLINDKFSELMKKDSMHSRKKVLAGIVMSKGYDRNSCKVIAVSTGTKCINGERMSVNGSVLNDSHAEIISRRCLCNFLYSELEKLLCETSKSSSIFEDFNSGVRLKPDYKFHLYINSAPCGDSRIFSPFDEDTVDKHPNRKARGQLRTKIECGEGTIPVKSSDCIQTWDGVIHGERLLTMSCSDKIAKWNVVGLQGALLSNFIEPIYLDSIILGSLFHPNHLYRAVCGRIENTIQGLPPPYRLNKPKLSTILNSEARQVGKSPNFSVNWTLGDPDAEIVNAVSGRSEQNQISRVAKCRLFYKYIRLAKKLPSITGHTLPEDFVLYNECKEKATNYQIAKRQLYQAFSKAKLGNWVEKPLEVDQFEWNETSLENFLFSDCNIEK